jgi:hypothetical protein
MRRWWLKFQKPLWRQARNRQTATSTACFTAVLWSHDTNLQLWICIRLLGAIGVVFEVDGVPSPSSPVPHHPGPKGAAGAGRCRQDRPGRDPIASWGVLFHGPTPPLDGRGFQVYDIVIVGPARQPDRPLGSQILQQKPGISQSLGCAILSLFSIGTQVDRPK